MSAVWNCSVCTAENQGNANTCDVCGEAKKVRISQEPHNSQGSWACCQCSLENHSDLNYCSACAAAKPLVPVPKPQQAKLPDKLELWPCSACSMLNANHMNACQMCQQPKSAGSETKRNAPVQHSMKEGVLDAKKKQESDAELAAKLQQQEEEEQDEPEHVAFHSDNPAENPAAAVAAEIELNDDNSWKCGSCTLQNLLAATKCQV
jgi:hypothetical protein